jgi:dolichol-phosphate mannosyltransferase
VTTSLSVVLPAYNEAPGIEDVILQLEREIVSRLEGVEVIVVDDASTDETPQILDRLAMRRPWLRIENAPVTRGHGPTIFRAIESSVGEWVFQIDSDGQCVISDFWALWNYRLDAPLILGVRRPRHDPRHRIALSHVVRLVVKGLTGQRIEDPNVPFRLFRRQLWDELRTVIGADALAPSILFSAGTAVGGHSIVQVPVAHLPRPYRRSSLRSIHLIVFALRGLAQLLAFRRRL